MNKEDKKAAIAEYKKRESTTGIFAVRCIASGVVWVGKAPNLDTIQNRLWFALRHGGSPHRELQNAWHDHGPEALSFEVLETLEHEELPYARNALLKERMSHWQSALNALPL
jgi:hypothetical protein